MRLYAWALRLLLFVCQPHNRQLHAVQTSDSHSKASQSSDTQASCVYRRAQLISIAFCPNSLHFAAALGDVLHAPPGPIHSIGHFRRHTAVITTEQTYRRPIVALTLSGQGRRGLQRGSDDRKRSTEPVHTTSPARHRDQAPRQRGRSRLQKRWGAQPRRRTRQVPRGMKHWSHGELAAVIPQVAEVLGLRYCAARR